MMISRLAHVWLYAVHFQEMLTFYGAILGLPRHFSFEVSPGREPMGWYFAAGNRSFIEIFSASEARARWGSDFDPAARSSRFRHICFEVDDLEATLTQLSARGVPYRSRGGGTAPQAFISDPDGNDIEFMQYLPGCRQLAPPLTKTVS